MAKVMSVVMNSVSHDARVLRQAEALRAAGHDVVVVGCRERVADAREEILANGIRVRRLGGPRSGRKRRRQPSSAPAATPQRPSPSSQPPGVELRRGQSLGGLSRSWFALRYSGAPLATLSFQLRQQARDALFAAAVRSVDADIVQAHDVGALPLGAALARTRGVPLIFDAHEIYDQDQTSTRHRAKSERDAHVIAHFARGIDGFITVNASLADYYAAHFPALPPAVVLPNAAPSLAETDDDGRLHRAAGFGNESHVLLYQGMFNGGRYLPELAASVAHLPDTWAVAIMGAGPLRGLLEATKAALPSASRSRLAILDPAPPLELAAWTAGASLGIIALEPKSLNFWFSSPNRLWSYPQAHVPFLASPFPEMRRVITSYGCGFELDEPVTPERIAAAVKALTPAQLKRAREGCSAFMEAEGWQNHAPRLIQLYERLLSTADAGIS